MFREKNATSARVTKVLPHQILLPIAQVEQVMSMITVDRGGSTRTALSIMTMILTPTFQGVTVPGTETASSLSAIF